MYSTPMISGVMGGHQLTLPFAGARQVQFRGSPPAPPPDQIKPEGGRRSGWILALPLLALLGGAVPFVQSLLTGTEPVVSDVCGPNVEGVIGETENRLWTLSKTPAKTDGQFHFSMANDRGSTAIDRPLRDLKLHWNALVFKDDAGCGYARASHATREIPLTRFDRINRIDVPKAQDVFVTEKDGLKGFFTFWGGGNDGLWVEPQFTELEVVMDGTFMLRGSFHPRHPYLRVKNQEGKFGIISPAAPEDFRNPQPYDVILPFEYDEIFPEPVGANLYKVRNGENWGLVVPQHPREPHIAVPIAYKDAYQLVNGWDAMQLHDGRWTLYDDLARDGERFSEALTTRSQFDHVDVRWASIGGEAMVLVENNGNKGVLRIHGIDGYAIPMAYKDIDFPSGKTQESPHLKVQKKDGSWVWFDTKTGKEV